MPRFEIWYLSGYFALLSGGAIIYSIREWGWSKLRALGLLAAYICAVETRMAKASWLGSRRNEEYSAIVIGIIVTCLFLLLLFTLNRRISSITVKWAGIAGAITYPLFLIHGRIGLLTIQNLANESNKYFVYGAILIALIAVAYLLLQLEKKVLNLRPFKALSGRA